MTDHTTTLSPVTTDAETIAISDAAAADAYAGMTAALAVVDALGDSPTDAADGIDAALAAVDTTAADVAKALTAMKPAPSQYSMMSALYSMTAKQPKIPCHACKTMVIIGEKCCGNYCFP